MDSDPASREGCLGGRPRGRGCGGSSSLPAPLAPKAQRPPTVCGPLLTLAVSCGWVHLSSGWVHLSLGLRATPTPALPGGSWGSSRGREGGGAAAPWSSGWELTLEAPPSPEDQVSNCRPGAEFNPLSPDSPGGLAGGVSRGPASLASAQSPSRPWPSHHSAFRPGGQGTDRCWGLSPWRSSLYYIQWDV